MIECILIVLVQIIYTVEDILWMHGVLQMVFAGKKRLMLGGVCLLFIAIYEGFIGFGTNGPPILILLRGFFILSIFQERSGTVLLKYFFAFFYLDMILRPIRWGFMILCRQYGISWDMGIGFFLNEGFQLLALILFVCVVQRKIVWKGKIEEIPLKYYAMGIVVGFFSASVWEVARIILEEQPNDIATFYEFLCLIFTELLYLFGIALPFVNELRLQYRKESQLKGKLLDAQKAYCLSLQDYMDSIRIIRHDMKHHLDVLDNYLQNDEISKAKKYLQSIDAHAKGIQRPIKSVNHPLVDAVIENQYNKMSKDIILVCEGKLPQNIQIEDYDLCTIFSNLLSNAKEACDKLQEHEKIIRLGIRRKGRKIVVEISNPIEWSLEKKKMGYFTSKEQKEEHGYGLRSVKKTVEKYHGSVDIDVRNELITIYVFL